MSKVANQDYVTNTPNAEFSRLKFRVDSLTTLIGELSSTTTRLEIMADIITGNTDDNSAAIPCSKPTTLNLSMYDILLDCNENISTIINRLNALPERF